MKSYDIHLKQTAKVLTYVLGRHPDEFGLVLDPEGFVAIKTLLKAMHEEPDFRHLRKGHLNELILNFHPAPIEIQGSRVRAASREELPEPGSPDALPKLLYTAIRQRAYPAVLEKGVQPSQGPHVILSSERAMAERLGKRIDNQPVVLTIQVTADALMHTVFKRYGGSLYLTDHIPAGGFSGPALPREKPKEVKKPKPEAEPQPFIPGSYFPDPASVSATITPAEKNKRANQKKAWQTERRRARKQKHKGSQ